MRFRGPWSESYAAAATMVVFALVPYLALTAALTPLVPVLSRSLHLSPQSLELTDGMANAAYAVGTVLAVQFAQHLRQRRMLLLYVTMFVIGSVLAAWAPVPGLFIAGHIVQGLCTSLMLIAAVPPLVTGFPVNRMPWTGAIMNMCIFGAVAAGPSIGGVQASAMEWRPLFWIVAGCGTVAWLFTLLTYEDVAPQDTSAPWDWVAIGLAALGCAAAFFGASELDTHPFISLITFLPLVGGVLLVISLVVYEFRVKRPLMPVRQFATTKPVGGIIFALTAGAASVAAIDLILTALQSRASPGHVAVLFLPQLGGAFLTAAVFGALFRTRYMVTLPFAGILALAGGIAVATGVAHGSEALVLIGSGLMGIGVGSAVSPALFVAGFSLASAQIQRVFALIELLRAVAAFMVAPVILHLAMTVDGGPKHGGITAGMWACFGIAMSGFVLSSYLFILGRARLDAPDLERWQGGEEAAWDTPSLLAGIRSRHHVGDLPEWREAPTARRSGQAG
ncbi:MAG TPA: MFS transporter [Solirubrobacteraceae bacterium]|nr:MFS transporter [Solirubrobacteraceae bacterium]